MAPVLTAESSRHEMVLLAGGKACGLHRLAHAGLSVPRWAVVSAQASQSFFERSGLAAMIKGLVTADDRRGPEHVAADVRACFARVQLDNEAREAIAAAYRIAGPGPVAVRSSGLEEDGSQLSFAGQHDSFLNVRDLDGVAAAVLGCWLSAFSHRSLSYRLSQGLPLQPGPMAVIVQALVAPDKSGVAFTLNPTTNAPDELVISAVEGLGEGLVSGQLDADTAVLDKKTLLVKSLTLGDRVERVVAAAAAPGTLTQPIAQDGTPCLSAAELAKIADAALKVERLFGAPQDIEWALAGGTLWLLQSRPVTTNAAGGRNGPGVHLWENSNIIENFSGVTSALTYSFARDVYHQVYREYARLLGVPRRELAAMDEWLRHMLGYHNGRVYYDLLNWYKIVRLVPFYGINRKMLDLAIGVEEPLPEETAARLHPLAEPTSWRSLAIRSASASLFAWHFLTVARSVRRFVRDFYRSHPKVDSEAYGDRCAEDVYQAFRTVRRDFLSRWGRMILLEQTLGLSVGILSTLVGRWLPQAGQAFLFDLMRSHETLDSLEPVHRMQKLAKDLKAAPVALRHVQESKDDGLLESLRAADHPELRWLCENVEAYIRDFGYRSLNELKLEEPDLREKPDMFFCMLRAQLAEQDSVAGLPADKTDARVVLGQLPFWKRLIIQFTANKVRNCLAARETVRFCRTRAFGTVRKMMKSIAADLVRRGLLANETDIFALRLEELGDWFAGVMSHDDLLALVRSRQAQVAQFNQLVAPPRFVTSGVMSPQAYLQAGWESVDSLSSVTASMGAVLTGTPCCAGRVSGTAAVVTEPVNVAGKVLVTYRTDPGWCAALPGAVALLIERGSPLTHVAIVARELGIPTIIQIKNLTRAIQSGMHIEVDGAAGRISVLSNAGATPGGPPRDPGEQRFSLESDHAVAMS